MERGEMLARLKKGDDPLDISIDKWRSIVNGKGVDSAAKNCALCETYGEVKGGPYPSCGDCPAYSESGCCYPYYFLYARARVQKLTKKEQIAAARKVRDYLKSLKKLRSHK